ncbi:hypothetical protein Nepgr_033241 [Nepenthes gracilis]|uniref:RRM domain-containing protein n=1 Tax=Nepenthes gracilis TaxID=150966 RepID=A0AAD3TK96_NEPGR|nr:hypothetical protein Nepgr_033241 [Nepenthes gracilis]
MKAESQEVENEKLKLQHAQFLEKFSELCGRDQKLSEEAPYANVSASTAVVEIKNLTGGSSIHFTGEVTNWNILLYYGKTIRIMYSRRDPTIRKSETGIIFVKNLDKANDNKALHDAFSAFGNILSCKIATDGNGDSKGYGFVQFENEASAENAIDKLNGMLSNDKQVYVGHFLYKQERESAVNKTKFNNVYVKNLFEATTNEDMRNITSAVVMRDEDGRSKCLGFINYENADDAARDVETLNGKKCWGHSVMLDDKEWTQKKSERELELKGEFELSMKEAADKYQGANLYIKNLDDTINEDKLKELFSKFGKITSSKVMRDPSGISRGPGFIAFSTPDEAKLVVNKPLYVALAQWKEESRAMLQAQFSQIRPFPMPSAVAPGMPMYPPSAPDFGQQIFYGQATPMIPPQVGFGYQHPQQQLSSFPLFNLEDKVF